MSKTEKVVIDIYTEQEITVRFLLTEAQKKRIMKEGVGATSRSANRTIAKALIQACEDGVVVPRGRETFAPGLIKKNVVSIVMGNNRATRAKLEIHGNYVHYRILNWIDRIKLSRKYPELVAIL